MLILTRKRDDSIKIGENIVVRVMRTGRGSVKIGIEAPDSVRIVRGELDEFSHVAATTVLTEHHDEVDLNDDEEPESILLAEVYDLDLVMQH